jgi:PPOX class probable F420-dependent enzyme
MIGTQAQDDFLSRNRIAVVTTLRRDGSPASSVIIYGKEGDTLFFSTTADRLKAKTLKRDPHIVLTAVEAPPATGYVSVERTGEVIPPERAGEVLAWHRKLLKVMRGPDVTEPEGYTDRLAQERRVIVLVTPGRVSGVPDRGARMAPARRA